MSTQMPLVRQIYSSTFGFCFVLLLLLFYSCNKSKDCDPTTLTCGWQETQQHCLQVQVNGHLCRAFLEVSPWQPCDTFSVDKQKACSIFNAFSSHNMQDINNGASSKHQPWLIKKFRLLIFNSAWITNMFEYPYVGLWNVTCAGFAVEFPASAHTKTYWSSFQRW